MSPSGIQENILKLIRAQGAASIYDIIEYLDYIDKVRYSEDEIATQLSALAKNGQIQLNEKLWTEKSK